MQTNFGDFDLNFPVFGHRLSEWWDVLFVIAILTIPMIFCALFQGGGFHSRKLVVCLICFLTLVGFILLGAISFGVAMGAGHGSVRVDKLWTEGVHFILWSMVSAFSLWLAIKRRPRKIEAPDPGAMPPVVLPKALLPVKKKTDF